MASVSGLRLTAAHRFPSHLIENPLGGGRESGGWWLWGWSSLVVDGFKHDLC